MGATNDLQVNNAKLAFNTVGLTEITSGEVTLPAPGAPPKPNLLSAAAGDKEVKLTWSDAERATAYNIYMGTKVRSYSAIETVTDNRNDTYTYTVKGLDNGTTYYFAIKGTNGGGESPYSNEMSATPQVPAPGAPVLEPIEANDIGDGQVTLHWSKVDDALGYKIYHGTESRTYSAIRTEAGVSCTVTELNNGTTYYFAVSAMNPGGESPYSNEISAKPLGVPDEPTDVRARAGNKEATIFFTAPTDSGGSQISKYIVTSNPDNITAEGTGTKITVTGLTNGKAYTFTVKAVNVVGVGAESEASNSIVPRRPSDNDNDTNNNNNQTTTQEPGSSTGVDILVNGKTETAATATTTQEGNKTVTTVVVDNQKVEEKLEKEGNGAVVTIPVQNTSDVVVGQLNGQTVKNMETKGAVLEIKTESVTYTLPAEQINIDNVSEQIGSQVELRDIKVNVTVSEPPADTVKIVEDTASKNKYQIVIEPVEFEVTCTRENKTVKVSKFNAYVQRRIAIPDGIDPRKITTGIILNEDGTFSHVPTTIVMIEGKYYAKINSLTNSTYSVIYNQKEFTDTQSHWAKEAINDMASRLVVNGVGDNKFEPNRDITRAEFAAVMVKGLGLMRPNTGKDTFTDVSKNTWYYDAVSIAYENGILSGYGDGKFGPQDKITREQAMAMIKRAMKLTGLKVESEVDIENLLMAYGDSEEISEWARESIDACIRAGIITGRDGNILAPKDEISRAEVAVIIRRLLQKSDLI